MVGGFGPSQEINQDIQDKCDQLQLEIQQKLGQTFDVFKGISFQQQLVSGMNYLVLIDVGNNQTITVKIYQPLPHTQKPQQLIDAYIN